MGTWMAWANEDPYKLLCKCTCNFWIVMGCGQPKNHHGHHAVSQRQSHQDFWIQHMNGWRWLLIYLSAQLAQSETAVNLLSTPIFCLYFGVLPGFYWFHSSLQGSERIFLSLHTKHPPVPVRCNWIVFARQMHSTTEFAMTVLSKCVCVSLQGTQPNQFKLPIALQFEEEENWKEIETSSNNKLKDRITPHVNFFQCGPISSKRKVKMGWEMQERDKRWWRIGVCNKCMSKRGAWKECMQ